MVPQIALYGHLGVKRLISWVERHTVSKVFYPKDNRRTPPRIKQGILNKESNKVTIQQVIIIVFICKLQTYKATFRRSFFTIHCVGAFYVHRQNILKNHQIQFQSRLHGKL